MEVAVPPRGAFWSDPIHLSDRGLRFYMNDFEKRLTEYMRKLEFIFEIQDFPVLNENWISKQHDKSSIPRKIKSNKVSYTFSILIHFVETTHRKVMRLTKVL